METAIYSPLLKPILTPENTNQTTWADLGAGTGMFTQILLQNLTHSTVHAIDKNPHALWKLPHSVPPTNQLVIDDVDFTRSLPFEKDYFDGMVMANALHYSPNPLATLQNILPHLKKGGQFVLVEYEVHRANPPWIPYPLPFLKFREIAPQAGLQDLQKIGAVISVYYQHIYSCVAWR